jgi:hypothetical protein
MRLKNVKRIDGTTISSAVASWTQPLARWCFDAQYAKSV